VSGPLRDRIDIQIEVPALPRRELLKGLTEASENSAAVRQRVFAAWQIQLERQGVANARLSQAGLARHCTLPDKGEALLAGAMEKLGLSARAFHRILRIARTLADLDARTQIEDRHLSEAISYRRLDRITSTG
jgi:magnesium chelatase family protein